MACSITSPATLKVQALIQEGPGSTVELAALSGISESTVNRCLLLLRDAGRVFISGVVGQAPIYQWGNEPDHPDYRSWARQGKRSKPAPKHKRKVNKTYYAAVKEREAKRKLDAEQAMRNPHPMITWGAQHPNALTGKFFTETGLGCP